MSILEEVCVALEEEGARVEQESVLEHPDCDGCHRSNEHGVCQFWRMCKPYRAWFKHEWNGIREAAKRMGGGNG